jgi:tetratricopeptide (TPR) repeat protein
MKLLFTPYLILCLTLFTLPAQAQLSGVAVADSLLQIVRVSKPDSSRVKLYLQLGEYYLYKPGEFQADMDSAFAYATKAQGLSRSLAFVQGYEDSQKVLAFIFLESKKISELQVLLEKMKPDKNKAYILYRIGAYYLHKPYELPVDLDSATYYAQAALTLQMQLQDSHGQAGSLILLAHINIEQGNLPIAKRYQQKAISVIEKVKDLILQAGLWIYLGDSYTRSEESMPDKINHFGKALALYRQLGNKEKEASTLKTIADMHQHQGDYAQSLRELLEVLRIQKSIGFQNLHYTYDLLGVVYAQMGNYELALPYALDAIRSAKATADTTDLRLFYNRVGQIYLNLNQHVQALEIFRTLLIKLSRESDNIDFGFGYSILEK